MRKILPLIAAAVLTAAPAAAREKNPEVQLTKALEGRVAGEPVNCISLHRVRSSQIIDKTAIIYDAGSTIYVNRPRSGASSLDNWDTLVTRLHGSQLCKIDTVRLVDPSTRMQTGLVFLGDFVPYRRAPKQR